MKLTTPLTLLSIALLCFSASSQETEIKRKDVPPVVLAAFDKAYTTVKVLEWEKEIHGGKVYFEAETVDGKVSRNVLYTPDGSLAQVTEKIMISDLPPSVTDQVKRQYPAATIRSANKVSHAETVEFSLSLNGSGPKKIVVKTDGTIASAEGKTALDREP